MTPDKIFEKVTEIVSDKKSTGGIQNSVGILLMKSMNSQLTARNNMFRIKEANQISNKN